MKNTMPLLQGKIEIPPVSIPFIWCDECRHPQRSTTTVYRWPF